MKSIQKSHISALMACLVVGLFLTCAGSFAQERSDEDLKKEYAPILGEYMFESGMGSFTLKFYIEGGALWADSGDGRPATMKPVDEEGFAFTAEDSINGLFQLKFLKDDQGEYSQCHVVNDNMGLDIKGTKIK